MANLNAIFGLLSLLVLTLISHGESFRFRIQGGRDPKLNEIKYIVAVVAEKTYCGGGIIDDKYIVTAAHCVHVDQKNKTLLRPLKIVANTNSTSNYNRNVSIEADVARAFIPTIRLTESRVGDIALLELKKSLNLKKNHQVLEKLWLPEPYRTDPITYPTYSNLTVRAGGFGATRTNLVPNQNGILVFKAMYGGRLHVAKATVNDKETCEESYNDLKDALMCVSVTEDPNKIRLQGICNGDSGSPIVLYQNGRKVIIGVLSRNSIRNRSQSCNNNLHPSLASRISSHIPFINKVLSGNTTGKDIIVYT